MDKPDIQLFEYFLRPGYVVFNAEPSILSTVLGSNVAVSLWDQKKKYGGMANFLYPVAKVREGATAQYGNVAIRCLVGMLLEEGVMQKDMKAQIFGGSRTDSAEGAKVARENIQTAKRILMKFHIAIVSEDVGGQMGRKVVYNTLKNEAIVYKVNNLRSDDWYPYIDGGDR